MIFAGSSRGRWFVWCSFLVALVLDILPLPSWVIFFRPLWTVLVLAYWIIMAPYIVGVGCAFVLGIILDLLCGTTLGIHALVLVILGYFIAKFQHVIRIYPLPQQMIVLFVLLGLYQLMLFLVLGIVDHTSNKILYWMNLITSTLLWPWLFILLQEWQRKLGVA